MSSLLSSVLATTSWWEIGAVVALAYAVHKIIKFEVQSPLAKLPGPRPSFLSIVYYSARQLFVGDIDAFLNMHAKYGTVVRAGPNTVWVSSAAGIRKLFSSHAYAKAPVYDAFKVGGDNLFSTRDVDYHKVQKRLMLPGYTPMALNQLEPLISKVGIENLVTRLTRHAKAGEVVDLMDLLQCMTFDVIGEIGFGKSFDLLSDDKEQHPIMQWMTMAGHDGMMKVLLGPLYHPVLFPNNVHSLDSLLKFARETIKKRRDNGDVGRNDTLQKMIDAVDEETGATMSEEQLVAQSIMLMVAGTDTTAATITWTMHLLFEHPEYLRKLYDEIKSVYPDHSTPISHDDIQSLPYLDAVLHESMRLRPIAAHGMTRLVPEGGIVIDGHYIPAGTNVITSVVSLHHTESVFPNPTVFNPDRWITTPEELAELKQHWVAFSVGPRSCIGRSLAWMELRLAVVELVRRFTFTPIDGYNMTPVFHFILRPKDARLMVKPHLI
ncbi:cytochrome P450 [Syncephalis plumigaleata]|nr:cytochrome P450 [Syncephalis plumigaleata]